MIFNCIGGGGGSVPTLTFQSWYGTAPQPVEATFDKPADPSQTGYTFGGWYKDEACTQPMDWADEAKTATLHAKWAIEQPTVAPGTPGTYDGTEKALGTVTAKGAGQTVEYQLDGGGWTSAAPKATNAGTYTVGWRVTAEHCETITGSFSVTIEASEIQATVSGTETTYTGSPVKANAVTVISPASGYELRYGTVAGTYDLTEPPSFTDAGSHTVYYRITAPNYETKTGAYTVEIAKASCGLSIVPTSMTVKEGEGDGTIQVTRTGGGTITATASPSGLCTLTVSGTTVTVAYADAGTATVTVSVAETSNYLGGSATCTVELESALEIVSWASGTDEQIAAMVAAADAGQIDLSDYWSEGDTRTVRLSSMSATGVGESHAAQSVQFVLSDPGHFTLASGKPCNFVVNMKDCLKETGYMNSSNTNSGGWNGCARRTWCNNVFRNAIPSGLRPAFKQFKTKAATGTGTASTTSTDWFALPSEMEVFGRVTYANSSAESGNTQLNYYKTSSNRVKKVNGGADWWWERSPHSGYSTYFCVVSLDGSAGSRIASLGSGLSPFGCI